MKDLREERVCECVCVCERIKDRWKVYCNFTLVDSRPLKIHASTITTVPWVSRAAQTLV